MTQAKGRARRQSAKDTLGCAAEASEAVRVLKRDPNRRLYDTPAQWFQVGTISTGSGRTSGVAGAHWISSIRRLRRTRHQLGMLLAAGYWMHRNCLEHVGRADAEAGLATAHKVGHRVPR